MYPTPKGFYICSVNVCHIIPRLIFYYFFYFFSVRLFLSVLRGHSVFSSPPQRPMTSDFEGFSIPDVIHYIYFPILILEKEPVFPPFACSVLNKGTTGTVLITSLVWRGPWLGIEPGTSRTIPIGYRGGGVFNYDWCVLKKENGLHCRCSLT